MCVRAEDGEGWKDGTRESVGEGLGPTDPRRTGRVGVEWVLVTGEMRVVPGTVSLPASGSDHTQDSSSVSYHGTHGHSPM